MSTLTTEPLQAQDVPTLASLHRRAFSGFFLSSLGEPFLREFYRGFVDESTAVTVVLHDESGHVLGCAVGTTEPRGFFGRLLRRRWVGFAAASARAVLRRPTAVGRLVRAVGYRGGEVTPDGALLSSICVDPGVRGSGGGSLVLAAWERRAAELGAASACLTTDAVDNDRVNDFYVAMGWTLTQQFDTAEGRAMNLYTKRLEPAAC